MYSKRLTKKDLMDAGITEITKEGKVFIGDKEVKLSKTNSGYSVFTITRTIGLHRAIYAWYNNEVPDGYVVDHINNKHSDIEDYTLENL